MGTRIGFVASEKGAEKECDVGLGLRMQTNDTKSFSSRRKMMMMMTTTTTIPHHHTHQNHHNHNSNEDEDGGDDDIVVDDESSLYNNRAFVEESCNLGSGGGGGGTGGSASGCGGGGGENDSTTGPKLFCNTSNQVVSMANIYNNIVGLGSSDSLPKTLLIPNSESFYNNPSSGGGIMVHGNMRFPFTADQRQELERQTMIFKYMMASIPIPHQLLPSSSPKTIPPSNFAYFHSSNQLGMSNNNSDQEPWRCRRTDGKKWRCSRNVIPDQKYCERHSHKSRPRSRKHVELQSHFLNNNNNNTKNPYSKPESLDQQRKTHQHQHQSHDNQPRSVEWFMNSNQEWQHMIHQQQQTKQGLNDQFSLLLDSSSTDNQSSKTRHFIDAWSIADERDQLRFSNSSSSSSSSSSSLALSIHNSNNNNEVVVSQNAQMSYNPILGSGMMMINNNNNNNNNQVSWSGSVPHGGPLAEALCLGMPHQNSSK
ncbi:growth-regulating factor 7 isoform X2 [Cannabis sativa]|uniref:growth-regulating factor 7 isoform X2 n=1 Tax=Cannabis sativa TaxID=3483 RepID=UPI0029CA6B4D|nr:growth-regulating factor 7 isoform X2 [Cannabis sativa]